MVTRGNALDYRQLCLFILCIVDNLLDYFTENEWEGIQ